ncbi:MAG TPA: cytochrome c biogenesis protein CcsA [Spirochaetota bacterium]|nr:cytochrome c biogenesis protein CcsA [Spirochaetota bacterium]HOS39840.1 cytochrome c biogenesis protein CcsA [Spirochaetota bacterium]HPU87971.1 cytochrome c biogenesis protein CcsA [Spirochaetota bacterium]
MTIGALIYGAVALYAIGLVLYLLKREQLSFGALGIGFAAHTAYQIWRAWLGGVFIPNGMVDGVFLLPWAIAGVIILLRLFGDRGTGWLSGLVPLVIFGVFALVYPKGMIPPTPNKLTLWAPTFFFTEAIGHACFYLGAWYALQSIINKSETGAFHMVVVWGFVAYSLSQIVGAIWAYNGWATTFRWGSRHLQSAVIWCFYATYLHLRYMPGWGMRARARYAAVGFVVVALCTFGSHLNEMRFPRIGG